MTSLFPGAAAAEQRCVGRTAGELVPHLAFYASADDIRALVGFVLHDLECAVADSDAPMKDLAALLQGIASLAWPVVALIALLMFRKELKSILGRLRKGKAFGTELELSESLNKLELGVAGVTRS
jgi:hypothetical protein